MIAWWWFPIALGIGVFAGVFGGTLIRAIERRIFPNP